MLLNNLLHIIHHQPRIRLVHTIPLLMALQRRTIKRQTPGLQLRKIKHHHLRHIDKSSELLGPERRKALRSADTLDPRLDPLGPLQQVFFDDSSHARGAGISDGCKDALVGRRCQLAFSISHEGKGALDGLPEADWVRDGVDGAEC